MLFNIQHSLASDDVHTGKILQTHLLAPQKHIFWFVVYTSYVAYYPKRLATVKGSLQNFVETVSWTE